ncbi:MAG: DHHW family protein [Oscillospiraceae bacterium]
MNKKVLIIAFFSILILLPLFSILLPKDTFSQTENRPLQQFVAPTKENLLSREFMDSFEKFLADHLVFREAFIKIKTDLELAQGKKEINNIFISDKMLLEHIQLKDKSVVDANIKAINDFARKYKSTAQISTMLVPTAAAFYPEKNPSRATLLDQPEFCKQFYNDLVDVTAIDAYSFLAANKGDYLYYKTDHHWTSLGAYWGYSALAKPLGFKPIARDMFNIEHASHDFLGTLYSKALYGEKLKDVVDIYHYADNAVQVTETIKNTGTQTQTYPSILFRKFLNEKDKYSVFLGSNDPMVTIKSDLKNGKKILIFKDSYTNALMQFLPLHYEEITLLDLRYVNKSLSEYVDFTDYSQILFLYNVANIISDNNILKIMN